MSMFQRRHYEAIARAMQETYSDADVIAAKTQWLVDRDTLVSVFARDNSNFDADRFRRACIAGNNVRARS
jgi:hypothetical protein